jgi:hypothetical protein
MNATASPRTNGTVSPAPVQRGFRGLRCPLCGNEDAIQSLDLDDLHTLHCAEYGDEYTLDDVRNLIVAWERLFAWIDLAPVLPAAE